MNKYFVTTPIYYVNDVPHIGHTYTTLAADVVSRYHKLLGYDTRLLTGTDEHGAKIAEAAQKHNQQPKQYADFISSEFKTAWDKLSINYSRFIRTTDGDHIKTVQALLQKLYDKAAINPEPRLYTGLYCVGCERFLLPEELKGGLCPDHLKPPIKHSEENYYFNLSRYQSQLTELITKDEIKVRPLSRKNEILGKLDKGLGDISISRSSLSWGIPLPFDPTHTAYVWIDALINYYTFGSETGFWPANLHIIGKDILWFHSVIWPAVLLAAEVPTPRQIFAHGFFTINGQKISKTLGNVIKPDDLINKYTVDGTRYVLLASFPFGEDGDFSWEHFDRLYNADLANGLGNLVGRVAKLCEKNSLSAPKLEKKFDKNLSQSLNDLKFYEALLLVRERIAAADKLASDKKPWEMEGEKAKEVLLDLVKQIQHIAYNLQPFLPEAAKKILNQFSGEIKSQPPLFPRI